MSGLHPRDAQALRSAITVSASAGDVLEPIDCSSTTGLAALLLLAQKVYREGP